MTVYVTGDKHGEVEMSRLFKKNRKVNLTEEDILIIAGDFGLLWSEPTSSRERNYLDFLTNAKWTTIFVDGNHENHNILDNLPLVHKYENLLGQVNDKIYHAKRGHIYNIQGHSIFTFGGALSIDKYRREENVSWWAREIPSEIEHNEAIENIKQFGREFDYVITHTAPSHICELIMNETNNSAKKFDPVPLMLDDFYNIIKFKKWYFGHWHINKEFDNFHCLHHDIIKLD